MLFVDYNINYLKDKGKENLENILIPYDLNVRNRTVMTRINNSSNDHSLIDYVIFDNSVVKKIFVSDSHICE